MALRPVGDELDERGSAGGHDPAVYAELERLRANFLHLQELYEDLRAKYNAHVHGGVAAGGANTAATVVGSQAVIQFVIV